MINKRFLLLQSNPISWYTLEDITHMENVVILHKKRVYKNRILRLIFNIHNSGRIQKYIELPFKRVWDYILFDKMLKKFTPDYIVFTTSWYSEHLILFFRKKCKSSKLIFRFSDTIKNGLGNDSGPTIEKLHHLFDGVLVYSKEDALKHGFDYHSVGYSPVDKGVLQSSKGYDVVFIGAEKGRMNKIRQAYNIFTSAGLSCFFYVLMVKEQDRRNDGIIYADKVMPFNVYLAYELSAKCLFEIVQDGSTGRTFRMMESIIYNKLLITNCPEIKTTDYYLQDYVQLYSDVSEINPSFVVNCPQQIDYHYKGDFSPIRVLEYIESKW